MLTAKDWNKVRNPYGRVRGRIEGPDRYGNPIEKPTGSANLDPWELSETKPPVKGHTRAGPRPCSGVVYWLYPTHM